MILLPLLKALGILEGYSLFPLLLLSVVLFRSSSIIMSRLNIWYYSRLLQVLGRDEALSAGKALGRFGLLTCRRCCCSSLLLTSGYLIWAALIKSWSSLDQISLMGMVLKVSCQILCDFYLLLDVKKWLKRQFKYSVCLHRTSTPRYWSYEKSICHLC